MIDSVNDILSDIVTLSDDPAMEDVAPKHDIFAVEARKSWDKSTEARCNFEYRPRISPRAGLWFMSIWQKSLMGKTLSEIKSDPAEIPHFAVAVSDFISKVL